jgi:hypothetical protein
MWKAALTQEIWTNLESHEGLATISRDLYRQITLITEISRQEGKSKFIEHLKANSPNNATWEEIRATVGYLAQKITDIESMALARAKTLMAAFRKKGLVVFSPGIHSIPQWEDGHRADWLAEDIFYLNKWRKGDGSAARFDSNLTMLFDESCFKPECYHHNFDLAILSDSRNWNSNGAFLEYIWAKSSYVRCVLAESLLKENAIVVI